VIREAALALLALLQGAPAPAPPIAYANGKGWVAVDGRRRINLVCAGTGSPTVVFTPGAGAPASSWKLVQPEVARRTRTCAWDRAGFGSSDPSPARQTAAETTRDLARALAAAKVAGPVVLVGHSIGAYETLLLADRLGRRLAGIVLVDPSLPDMFRITGDDPARVMAPIAAPLRACAAALRAGTPPAPGPRACTGPLAKLDTALSFLDSAGDSAREVVNPNRDYGAVPLVVLTAGPRRALLTPWDFGHDQLAALSTAGVNRYVPDSGHMMQRQRPDAIVAAVGEVLDSVSLSSHTTTR
jgi:pimeloyl-ACP methyl ester carboxylesterase